MTAPAELSRDAEEFLSYLAVERGRASASISAYRRDLVGYERFLAERSLSLAQADTGLVEAYVALLSEKLRPSSTARALAAVRGLHRFCVDERGAPGDPLDPIVAALAMIVSSVFIIFNSRRLNSIQSLVEND